MEIIRVENMSKSFGRAKVLDDISLVCDWGKVYGLVGDNGFRNKECGWGY